MSGYTYAEQRVWGEWGTMPGTGFGEREESRVFGMSSTPRLAGAWAGVEWQWAPPGRAMAEQARLRSETRAISMEASVLRIPGALLRLMRATARRIERPESELWAEAAREWLARRVLDDEPPPPAGAALAVPRPPTAWAAIDTLLADLRIARVAHTSAEFNEAVAAQAAA
jgi:hypothetical protein